jgi:hypothetical protein
MDSHHYYLLLVFRCTVYVFQPSVLQIAISPNYLVELEGVSVYVKVCVTWSFVLVLRRLSVQ